MTVSGALRRGKWKILHGHTAAWKKADASADMCTMRDGGEKTSTSFSSVCFSSTI